MKNFLRLSILLGFLFSLQMRAYEYEFSNHTNDPLKLRLKLSFIFEDDRWYETIIQPQGMHTFAFSPGKLDPIKTGFCLKYIHVALPQKKKKMAIGPNGEELGEVEELVKDKDGNVVFGPWADVAITNVKDEGANALIDAAAELTDAATDFAKGIANIAVEYKASKASK